jgi:hypothetical protein
MKELTLRKLHRYTAVTLLPLIMLQVVSGLFLSIEWLTGLHHAAGRLFPDTGPAIRFWDWLFLEVHRGGGRLGAVLNVLVGLGLLWLGVSGLWIFIRIQLRGHKR